MSCELMQKEKDAIERLKAFEPKDGDSYHLCYSGGKDSDVIRIIAKLAGVRHEIHHNLTTVDAPETIAYIKSIPNVIIDRARYKDGSLKTMWNLIVKKKMPPTRLMRWCCTELKEVGGDGKLKITGVRWDESRNRRENSDLVTVIGKPKNTIKRLESLGLNFSYTKYGGIILSARAGDNEILRDQSDFLHHCYRDRSVTINPIVDWTDKDVWNFLHHYGCSGNPLYKCGDKRIGCIGCPLSGHKQQKIDFIRYPKYKKNYIRAFDKMLKARKEAGMSIMRNWQTGFDVFKWFIGDNTNQIAMFEDEELYNAFSESE